MCSQKDPYKNVYSSPICNNHKLEVAQCPSTGGWINKLWHILTITKIVLGNKKNELLMHETTLINSKKYYIGPSLVNVQCTGPI